MCWSGEASAILATIGIATTIHAAYKKEPIALWITLGYFSSMELLQAFTYLVIDQCTLPANQIATLLGYLHISFQPFFINAICMHFMPDATRIKIQPFVYTVCFFSTIVMIIQLYPFDWVEACGVAGPLCSEHLCSVSGNWHIAWDVPINGMGNEFLWIPFVGGFPTYAMTAFILPLLYGAWRGTLYHIICGPFLAFLLTNNVNERPAVWCLLSIGILLLVVKTPIKKYMYRNKQQNKQ